MIFAKFPVQEVYPLFYTHGSGLIHFMQGCKPTVRIIPYGAMNAQTYPASDHNRFIHRKLYKACMALPIVLRAASISASDTVG